MDRASDTPTTASHWCHLCRNGNIRHHDGNRAIFQGKEIFCCPNRVGWLWSTCNVYTDAPMYRVCTSPGDRVPGPRSYALMSPVTFPWRDAVDHMEQVGSTESYGLSLQLSREGLICGPSSGFNLQGSWSVPYHSWRFAYTRWLRTLPIHRKGTSSWNAWWIEEWRRRNPLRLPLLWSSVPIHWRVLY